MNGNYIKISRNILEWGWYKNEHTKNLFIHMLLKANWKEGKFEGNVIPRGSFVSSIGKLAEETNLSADEVRTAIKHLIDTEEITKQSTNKYTVFTVNNYISYQDIPKQDTNQSPSSSQPIPKLFPTIEERKKGRRKESNISCSSQEAERELNFKNGIIGQSEDKCLDKYPPKKDYMADFLIIYKLYPKKSGKMKAYEYYLGWLKGRDISGIKIKLDNRQMYLAVKKYVQQCEDDNTELKFYKNFDTLMNKQILDYIEEDHK